MRDEREEVLKLGSSGLYCLLAVRAGQGPGSSVPPVSPPQEQSLFPSPLAPDFHQHCSEIHLCLDHAPMKNPSESSVEFFQRCRRPSWALLHLLKLPNVPKLPPALPSSPGSLHTISPPFPAHHGCMHTIWLTPPHPLQISIDITTLGKPSLTSPPPRSVLDVFLSPL